MNRLTIEQLWNRCDAVCEIEGRQGKVHGDTYKEYSSFRHYLKELQHYKDLEEQGRLIVQKQGEWVEVRDDDVYWYECSICHGPILKNGWGHEVFSEFCPNCGAKMDEE